jgi:hypothetical protein
LTEVKPANSWRIFGDWHYGRRDTLVCHIILKQTFAAHMTWNSLRPAIRRLSPRLRTSTKQLIITCAISKIRLGNDPLIEAEESRARRQSAKLIGMHSMIIHKRILAWKAAHPNTT